MEIGVIVLALLLGFVMGDFVGIYAVIRQVKEKDPGFFRDL